MPLEIYLVGPLLALAVLAVIVVAAGMTSTDRRPAPRQGRRTGARWGRAGAWPARRVARSVPDEFGLLRPVALVDSLAAARVIRARLTALGIRATVGTGRDGFVRVLVFAGEYDRARDAV